MSSRPPDRRHVTPSRDSKPISEPRVRSVDEVAPSRTEAAMNLSERRRLRRLKKATDENEPLPAVVPRGSSFRIFISMRWVSAIIVVALVGVLYLLFTRDIFFIHEISVGGTKYLTPEEIFERSGLATMHIFWVDPVAIAQNLEKDPEIANADVEVGWPPNMVQITITEREPALIWEQGGQRVWVDVRGRVMAQRRDLPTLVRVVVAPPSKTVHAGPCPLEGMDEVLGPGSCVDGDIVAGALQFKALYPNVTDLVYDPAIGLGYREGGGWLLWFGNGDYMATKMAVYNTIVANTFDKGVKLIEVNVVNPDAPYYKTGPSGG